MSTPLVNGRPSNGSVAGPPPHASRTHRGGPRKRYRPASAAKKAAPAQALSATSLDQGPDPGPDQDTTDLPEQLAQVDLSHANECFICTNQIELCSLGECGHRVCHVCALRLRVLYKSNHCPYCKANVPQMVISSNPSKVFSDFLPLTKLPYHDAMLDVYYDSARAHDTSAALLEMRCSFPGCRFLPRRKDWHLLQQHVHAAHQLAYCDTCVKHKKVFAYEHSLYPKHLLREHREKGDSGILRSVVRPDSSFTQGHPYCEFCKLWFFSSDELYTHCKKSHEECFLCQQQNVCNVYYVNYLSLEKHFEKDHFPCKQPSCLEKKFVVFDSDIALQAHMIDAHPKVGGTRRKIDLDLRFHTGTSSSTSSASSSSSTPPVRAPVPGFGGLTQPSSAAPTTLSANTTVMTLLGNDASAFSEFKALTNAMLKNALGPNDFVAALAQLVGKPVTDPLVRRLVETCPNAAQRQRLVALLDSKQSPQQRAASGVWGSSSALLSAGPVSPRPATAPTRTLPAAADTATAATASPVVARREPTISSLRALLNVAPRPTSAVPYWSTMLNAPSTPVAAPTRARAPPAPAVTNTGSHPFPRSHLTAGNVWGVQQRAGASGTASAHSAGSTSSGRSASDTRQQGPRKKKEPKKKDKVVLLHLS